MTKAYQVNTLEDQHIFRLEPFEFVFLRVIRDKDSFYIREEVRTDYKARLRHAEKVEREVQEMKDRLKAEGKREVQARFENFIKNGSDLECYYDVTDRRM